MSEGKIGLLGQTLPKYKPKESIIQSIRLIVDQLEYHEGEIDHIKEDVGEIKENIGEIKHYISNLG